MHQLRLSSARPNSGPDLHTQVQPEPVCATPERVNAIAPGVILWPEGNDDEKAQRQIIARTPLKRIGTPADIQSAVLFLARDAKFVTGQVLYIDGGRSIVA